MHRREVGRLVAFVQLSQLTGAVFTGRVGLVPKGVRHAEFLPREQERSDDEEKEYGCEAAHIGKHKK